MEDSVRTMRQNRALAAVMTAVLFVSVFYAGGQMAELTVGKAGVGERKRCVVLDAGHGGADPGKVGINGALEMDINLAIAEKLKMFLEMADVEVVMTREDSGGLYEEGASNKKVQDMKKRIAIIEQEQPEAVISIHQNSYSAESVKGAQVFYYSTSEEGKRLAEILQTRLVQGLDPENRRVEKANDSYFLLRKTSRPIVIVECGFLSNRAEAEKLCTEEYQEKVAWQLHLGILNYLNSNRADSIAAKTKNVDGMSRL